ncbi:LysR family transcriptional regulator [Shewanella sp. Isolate11]|uniref:LysR family transcriptional regulator n=1 Tax=Shewanella sp. Isolate11 TaxID=2908530 RepID=UPI001EFD20F8|nr:LysR family transcriptional regulator [Shewanella sp. Isolate11]MCG9696402.1 LysR substrate-binding domain-containing protein [Shewanella sp. Isolate11]
MDKLDTMRAFTAVVQEGAFAKAAEKLGISPQLVSKYVSQLEEQLKVRLLNRTTRRVNVTEAGLAYFERCQQVLIDIEEMDNALTDLSDNASGTLKISAPMSFAIGHLPDALTAFQQQYPEVKLHITLTDKKVDLLEDGVDVALRIGRLASSSLVAKKLAPIKLVICASPSYLQQHGTPETPQDLIEHNFLHFQYSDLNYVFSRFGEQFSALKVPSDFSCNNGDMIVAAAIKGRGIALQPTFLVCEALKNGQLQTLMPHYTPEPLGLYGVYAHRKFLASKVRCFINFLSQYFGDKPYWDELA